MRQLLPIRTVDLKMFKVLLTNQYDVGKTGPPYLVKLRTVVSFKGYVHRRIPAAIHVIMQEVVKIKTTHLVEEIDSPCSVPRVVVPKTYWALLFCIPFRLVILNIVNDVYPMYGIKDQPDDMAGPRVLITLDMTKLYHQLLLHKDPKLVTEFAIP